MSPTRLGFLQNFDSHGKKGGGDQNVLGAISRGIFKQTATSRVRNGIYSYTPPCLEGSFKISPFLVEFADWLEIASESDRPMGKGPH